MHFGRPPRPWGRSTRRNRDPEQTVPKAAGRATLSPGPFADAKPREPESATSNKHACEVDVRFGTRRMRNVWSDQCNQGPTRPIRNMRRIFLLAASLMVAASTLAQTTYSVRFDSEWSATTHPQSFPPNPHMSPLIGGTHNASYSMWAPGNTASPGVERMAETGGTLILESELTSPVRFGNTNTVISGGGIGTSPGTVLTTFEIAASHPLVSLVSMIAPSPDWFVGVHDLSLIENGEWISELTVDLFAYDAGTDSGVGYTSGNADTNPAQPISALVDGVFEVNSTVPRLGTFTFTCQTGCGIVSTATTDQTDIPQEFAIGIPYPNPAVDYVNVPITPSSGSPISVELVNLAGRSFLSTPESFSKAGQQMLRVALDSLPAGVWLIRVSSREMTETRRIVVLPGG